MKNIKNYKCIIFDLGGVLLNIDYSLTKKAFESLGISDFDSLYSQASQSDLFNKLEIGAITPAAFRDKLRSLLKLDLDDESLDKAWNSMLQDFPISRMQFLEKIAKTHQIILMSNTNIIHIQAFHEIINDSIGLERFHGVFDQVYYSSDIGKRKPHPATFQWILDENDLNASDCLFIDDSMQHIEGARAVGIDTVHLTMNMDVSAVFD